MSKLSIVFSTSGRPDLFEDTITSLIKHNPHLNDAVETVWILDDRSKYYDRNIMEMLVDKYFRNKGRLVTFNDSRTKWGWVAKFSTLSWIAETCDYVLFIEEDWRSLENIGILEHIKHMNVNPDLDQIIFSEHFFLQDDATKAGQEAGPYWSALDIFRHTYGFIEEHGKLNYKWFTCKPMFTFNPALVRADVYKRAKIEPIQDWEWYFHETINSKSIYTKNAKFVHTGEYRSAEGKTWG